MPGKVVEVKGQRAKIKQPDHEHWVNASLIEDGVKVGDYLLTYQNTAINKVSPQEAKQTLRLLEKNA